MLCTRADCLLTAAQSILRFSERAEQHRAIGAEYRSANRQIRRFLADYDATDRAMNEEQARTGIDLVLNRLEDLETRAPELSVSDIAGGNY